MKRNDGFIRTHALNILILLAFGVAICSVCFRAGYPETVEFGYHLSRTFSLADTLSHGIFPGKIRPVLNHTYGYGEGFFYPDFFLYLPAVLRVLGLSLDVSIKVMIFVMVLFGLCLDYAVIYALGENKLMALFGTLLYFSLYAFWYELYYEGGVGRWQSQIFLLAALGGLVMLLQKKWGGVQLSMHLELQGCC